MKKTKRLNRGLALFLALMMSLMPVTVFADEEPSGEGGTQILENEAAPPLSVKIRMKMQEKAISLLTIR